MNRPALRVNSLHDFDRLGPAFELYGSRTLDENKGVGGYPMLGAEGLTIDHVGKWWNSVETMQEFSGLAEFVWQKGEIPLGQIQPFRHIF